MATEAASSGFADFVLLTETIRALTVAQAKALIKDVNNEPETACGRLALSGNKPEIINRLVTSLTERKNQGDIRGYQKFRNLILRYKGPPVALPAYRNGLTPTPGAYGSTTGTGAYVGGQRLGGIPANKASSVASSSYSHLAAAAAPVSRPVGTAGTVRINFRPSPFYEIKQFVSPLVSCPEAPTQADRKNATLFVNFTPEQADMLKGSKHQLRLFCTTVEGHAASLSGRNPATVEFPLTCEARVNNQTLSTNLRGSKKNVGRVPPPNLNKDGALALVSGRPNRIDLTYTNAPKRHVLVAAICEITTVETLVERLRSKQFRSKEEVLSRMRKEAEDDEVEAGAATMSLKCPFSYMRIVTPCRSEHCSHVQCFDAESFFSVNEQTPSWACPICHKTIKAEELLMDGYVADILKRVPQDKDSVIVEPDGSWRTADGKVSSSGTAQTSPAAEGAPIQDSLLGHEPEDVKPNTSGNGTANGTRKGSPAKIVLLDSPSPPPQSTHKGAVSTSTHPPLASSTSVTTNQVRNGSTPAPVQAANPALAAAVLLRHERIELLSSSANNSARQSPVSNPGEVIDLTLDSDDESEPSVPTRTGPGNGNHAHPHASATSSRDATSNSINSSIRGGFADHANTAATPNRTGAFAAASSRVNETPEDEQIRRPGKRPRTEVRTDPRPVNGTRLSSNVSATSVAMPASYLDMGPNGARASNGNKSNGAQGPRSTATEANGGDGDDSWMDNDINDHEQYLNEDDWWSPP